MAGSDAGVGSSTGGASAGGASGGVSSDSSHDNAVSSDTSSQTSTEAMAAEPTTTDSLASEPTTAESLSGETATSDKSTGVATVDKTDSESACVAPGTNADEDAIDGFLSCTSGVTDRAAIDAAQAKTANGGCAAISDTQMLCDPVGPEIGQYTVGRPAGFPDYIGPNAPYSHEYDAHASTIGASDSLLGHLENRLQENPTPGTDQRATPAGVINDAGISPIAEQDLVQSSVSTDVQGRTVVSNVTIPGQHVLDPGIVSQTAYNQDGRTHAHVVGEGNGLLSIPTTPAASFVFDQKIEGDIRASVFADAQR